MNIIFQNEKQTGFTLLEIFTVKSPGIEIFNNGTVTATINDLIFWKNRAKSKLFLLESKQNLAVKLVKEFHQEYFINQGPYRIP